MINQRSFATRTARRELTTQALIISCLLLFLLGYTFAQQSAAADTSQNTPSYVVQPGDSLWSIARAHSTPQQDIRQLVYRMQKMNRLTSAILQPGQVLLLPKP